MNRFRLFTFALLLFAVVLAGCESSLTNTEEPEERITILKPPHCSNGALSDGLNNDDDEKDGKINVSGDDIALKFATAGFNEPYDFEVEEEEEGSSRVGSA